MSRLDEGSSFQVRFTWSPNAIKGFGAAMAFLLVSVLVSMCTHVEAPEPYKLPETTPVTLLVFGEGDGSGARKGNLTEEGAAQKGRDPQDPLADATRAASNSRANTQVEDPTQAGTHRAVPDVGRRGDADESTDASETVGSPDGRDDGTGLGMVGAGRGKGLGYGDIDWGGGGNRIVLHKVKPRFPPGTMNTEVKLRFRVRPDGTVSMVLPVRRGGDPAADAAAMQAMRQWRFNKLGDDREMEGTITFVFRGS